jgi:hypothetical protein
MIEHHHESLTTKEAARLDRFENRGLLGRIFRKADTGPGGSQKFLDSYQVSAEKCFVPADFNEELPLYLLDLGGTILVLFGQWLFDPHTSVVPADVFEKWDCERNFFKNFSLRCFSEHGIVFEFRVEDPSFIRVEHLSYSFRFRHLREYQLLAGHAETLFSDLQNANVIESE